MTPFNHSGLKKQKNKKGDEKGDSILPHRLFIEDEDFLDDEDGLRESPDLSTLEEISETEDIPDENNRNRDQDSLPEADTPTIEVLHNLLNVRNGEKTQEDAKPVTTEKEDLNLARESVVRIPIETSERAADDSKMAAPFEDDGGSGDF